MRYLKSFNEGIITDQFLSGLQDFCEMNLVYLMDDGLTVTVENHPISEIDTSYLSVVTLRYPLQSGTWQLLVNKNWNDIRDVIIPFFTRLRTEYNVISFDQLPIATYSLILPGSLNRNQVQFTSRRNLDNSRLADQTDIQTGYRKNYTIDDIVADNLDLGTNWIVEIKFYVSCNDVGDDVSLPKKKTIGSRIKKFLGFGFNESVDFESSSQDNLIEELEYQMDIFLAPLEEEGFVYDVKSAWHGEFVIRLSRYNSTLTQFQLYDYAEVMDRFIPLVRMLSRNYDMCNWVYFYSTQESDINKKIFSLESISDGVKPDFLVTTVKLTLKGKKD